jgi:putative transposase
MPNHVHGIIHIDDWDPSKPIVEGVVSATKPGSLSAIVGSMKSAASRLAHQQASAESETIWQRGFFERIIRDEPELLLARKYIEDNPSKWEKDPIYIP